MATGLDVTITVASATEGSISFHLLKTTPGGDTGKLQLTPTGGGTTTEIGPITLTSQATIPVNVYNLPPSTTYTVVYYSTTEGMVLSEEITASTTYVNKNKIMYGPVSNLTRRIDMMYGSVKGRTTRIQKIYGSVNNKATLVHLNLGEIPRPGSVTFYTDNTYTTTQTVRIISQSDLEALCGTSSSSSGWSITMDGETFTSDLIKEVSLPTWCETIPNNFLVNSTKLDTLDITASIDGIGDYFLSGCTSFNQPLDLYDMTSLGSHFLDGCTSFNSSVVISSLTAIPDYFMCSCSSFNQPLDISKITTTGYRFLYSCSAFNQPLDTSRIYQFGGDFLKSCSAFNQPLDLSSAMYINSYFLQNCTSFNQSLIIPNIVTSVGAYFMNNCNNMTSTVTVNTPATVASTSNYTFSTSNSNANCYTQGIKVAGLYAQEWKARFANRDVNPYRNLGYSSVPILYDLEFNNLSAGGVDINYGVVSWDMTGTYTSGTVKLYRGNTPGSVTTQVSSYNAVGINVFSQSGLSSNTKYYYKATATNNGNLSDSTPTSSIVTAPAALSLSMSNGYYESYNKFVRQLGIRIAANGNYYPQTIQYRFKKTADSNYGEWRTVTTYNKATSTTVYTYTPALDTETEYIFQVRSTTPAGEASVSQTQPAIPTHPGPTDVQYTYSDSNSSVQSWLSTFSGYNTGTWFIAGQSTPKVEVTSPGVLAKENDRYINILSRGFSTTLPQIGTVVTNMGSLNKSTGGTLTAPVTGYIVLRVQTSAMSSSSMMRTVREEIVNSMEIIDVSTGQNVFDKNTMWFDGYFETSNGEIKSNTGGRNTIIYAPVVSGKQYRVTNFKTTGATTLVEYDVDITRPDTGYSTVIPYSSTTMAYTFPVESLMTDQTAGVTTTSLEAVDSKQARTQWIKAGTFLTWAEPTFTASAQRIGEIGGVKISFSGNYAGLHIDALNNGNDLNSITVEYRVLDYTGSVITDWTEIDDSDIQIVSSTGGLLDRGYSGITKIRDSEYRQSIVVDIRASDHFGEFASTSIPLDVWEKEKELNPVNYEIELWDWKTNTFVADLSYLVAGDLNINWELNDIEEIEFSMDLVEFEEKCQEMGVDSSELLAPYKHDVRVRRNGNYILGGQLVEANIQIPNNSPALVNVKCTGFLNLFKDQYLLDETWSGYTYAEIARKLVLAAQKPDCLIKNPTGDIDTSYWLSAHGTISSSTLAYEGDRCIAASRSGTGYVSAGTQMETDSGENIVVDVWVKGQSGIICSVRERERITTSSNQMTIGQVALDGSWQHLQFSYTTFFKEGYLLFECNRTNASYPLYVDNCYVYAQDDDAVLCNLNVPLGVDTASPVQEGNRQVSYSLQNIKDAILDLVKMDEDGFDFDFSYDRTFNCYSQKGSEKLDVEVLYPGNVESVNIGRSAANLANKIYNIGSGIGDERLQVDVSNSPSRRIYGTRESITTNSNVELESTLSAQAIGDLYDKKDPTNLPTVVIKDGSINPEIVQVGDYVPVSVQGDSFLGTINGVYRIMKISLSVSENAVETMKLTFEPREQRPEKKMIRYIRDSLVGCSTDTSVQWNEIQALMLVGNEYVNVAKGATVYGSSAFSSGHGGSLITDGNTSTYADMPRQDYTRRAITIDLGDEYPIDYVKVWHYYPDGRTMYGEHLSVGTELPDGTSGIADLETLLWAHRDGTGYVETSAGRQSRWLQESEVVQPAVNDDVHMIRYIRESHIGNSSTTSNIWAEIDAALSTDTYITNGLKCRCKMFYSDRMLSGSGITAPVDGDTGTYYASGNEQARKRRSITLDLGGLYPVSYVKLFHYIPESRVFRGSRLSVGKELPGEPDGIEDLETVLWADDDNSGIVETSSGRQSSLIQALPNNVEVDTPITARYIKDSYLRHDRGNDTHGWHRISVYVRDPETGTLRDIAMGKSPTFTSNDIVNGVPTNATDDIENSYISVRGTGYQSAVLDLGDEYPIDYIRIKHHGDERKTYGCRLSFGNELTPGNDPLENIVWDDGETYAHQEWTPGRWSGWIQQNPQPTYYTRERRPVRYIRDCIAGSSANGSDHWVEIMAYIYKNGSWQNVALNKPVSTSIPPSESGHNNPQVVTDGNIESANYFGLASNNNPQAVTIDLGDEYYIDYVRVWHYFEDGRRYKKPVLSVGRTLPENDDGKQPLETILWNNEVYDERNTGALSKWVQGDL